jgi:decaprenyl-phosphate phosphoribosyltransferase
MSDNGLVGPLVRSARPSLCPRNLLVFAAPGAAGVLSSGAGWRDSSIALVSFVLASSCTYMFNDVWDRERDRQHEEKRDRPVASGALGVGPALFVSALLLTGAIALPFATGHRDLTLVIAAYLTINAAYSFALKHVVILELFSVSSGYVLRALAGAVAAGVPASPWFLIVISTVSLHVVASKRAAELSHSGEGHSRPVLADYTKELLDLIRSSTLSVALIGYLLWTFTGDSRVASEASALLSAIPFALCLFRYSQLAAAGSGEQPDKILRQDAMLLSYVISWVVVFFLGVYVFSGG